MCPSHPNPLYPFLDGHQQFSLYCIHRKATLKVDPHFSVKWDNSNYFGGVFNLMKILLSNSQKTAKNTNSTCITCTIVALELEFFSKPVCVDQKDECKSSSRAVSYIFQNIEILILVTFHWRCVYILNAKNLAPLSFSIFFLVQNWFLQILVLFRWCARVERLFLSGTQYLRDK